MTVRPKRIVGSAGSVWASEYMNHRANHPELFETSNNHDNYNTRQYAAFIDDTVKYYMQTTFKEDFKQTLGTNSDSFVCYEQAKLTTLTNRLRHALELFNIGKDGEKGAQLQMKTQSLVSCAESLVSLLSKGNSLQTLDELLVKCKAVMEHIDGLHLPPTRPFTLEFTDAGPGVGVSNYEVQFREIEIAMLHKSTLRHRVHLARDDQGQNEAERTNSYIGKYSSKVVRGNIIYCPTCTVMLGLCYG